MHLTLVFCSCFCQQKFTSSWLSKKQGEKALKTAGVERRWHVRARKPASNESVCVATKQRSHDVYNNVTITQVLVTMAQDADNGSDTLATWAMPITPVHYLASLSAPLEGAHFEAPRIERMRTHFVEIADALGCSQTACAQRQDSCLAGNPNLRAPLY